MNTHVVSQGECLATIAKRYYFADWRTLYDHPDNAPLKRKRPNPNLLYPGDVLVIPDKQPKQDTVASKLKHQYTLRTLETILRLKVADDEGAAYANRRYQLTFDGAAFEGITGADGLIEHPVAPDADKAELLVWLEDEGPPYPWSLAVGHLDPVEDVSGVQARLNNLGFSCGRVDGVLGPKTRAALRAFQASSGLEVTGENSSATEARLRHAHDEA